VRMMAGIIAAGRYMADPRNADRVATIAEVTGRSHAIALGALKDYVRYGLWPTDNDGLNPEQLTKLIAFLAKVGNIKQGNTPPPVGQIIDPTIWRDANAMVNGKH